MGRENIQTQHQENQETAVAEKSTARAKTSSSMPSYGPSRGLSLSGADSPNDIPFTPDNLLFLQRTIGNREVVRLLQRKGKLSEPGNPYKRQADRAASQSRPPASPLIQRKCHCGTCEKCSAASAPSHTSAAQAKPNGAAAKSAGSVIVGEANDPKEHEADRVAEAATRSTPQRMKADGALSTPTHGRPSLRPPDSGSPLSGDVREKVEPLLGADLSHVRVHDSAPANDAAVSLNAKAFTHYNHIYLGPGQRPDDMALLAHEATHVAQQSGAPPLGLQRKPDPPTATGPQIMDFSGVPVAGILLGGFAKGIQGPLPAGKLHEDGELRILQEDLYKVRIDYGHSWVTIDSTPGQTYEYFVEQTRSRTEDGISFSQTGLLNLNGSDQPAPQVAVRIAATPGVRVDRFQDDTEGAPQLAIHERYAGVDDISTSPLFGDVRELWDGNSAVLSVDESAIKISPPSDRSDLNPHNFPDAKFAFWIDPVWTGPRYAEKKVFIVASPGVGLMEGEPGMFNRAYSYDRKIVPEFIRVPHPAMVPSQGEPINPESFVGYQQISPLGSEGSPFGAPQETSDDMIVATSFSGVTIVHPYGGAKVSISAKDRSVGAAYAYEVLAREGGHPGEIRVVVGPGAFISVEEPAPVSWRNRFGEDTPLSPGEHPSWFGKIRGPEFLEGIRDLSVEVHLREVDFADQVPLQGTPLNVYYLGRTRQPDEHQWVNTSDLASTIGTTGLDIVVGVIPIVGDLVDIAEFVWALGTDHDRWGRPVSTGDKVLMGIGAVIGLIPFLGGVGSLLRGGAKAAIKIADAARSVGKTLDELELILWQLRRVTKSDDAVHVDGFIRAVQRGEDLPVEDMKKLQELLGRVGAGDLPSMHRFPLNLPEGAIVDIQHPALKQMGAASDWRRSLNAETRAYLQASPEVSKVYEQMDEGVRILLTKCASFCLPPVPPSLDQQAAIKRLLIVANPTPDDAQLIRTFLHKATDLDAAIKQLSEIATPTKLRRFLTRHVDMADAALIARDAWRMDPAFQVMREQARTLVKNGMSVDQLSKIMGQAARAGEEGPEFLGLVNRLWHTQPRPAGTNDLLSHLAAGGARYKNSEWMLRYLDRGRAWDGLKAFEFSEGRWAAHIKGEVVEFRAWQRFDSEEFVKQMAADYSSGRKTKWVFEPGSPLGSADDIQAAGQQALQDALRRGDPRVTQDMVNYLVSDMAKIIDMPSAHKFVKLNVDQVRATLSALESQFPILKDLPLDVSALQRVITKGPEIDAMKGQLVEEFMAVSVRKSLETPAGRQALGLGKVQGELRFIEGHRISLGGRQLTDGVIAVERGGKLEILVIFEAKSGRGSAGGLVSTVQTVKSMKDADKLELFNFIRGEMPEQLYKYLSDKHPDVAKLFELVPGKKPRLNVRTGLGSKATREEAIEAVNAIRAKIPSDVLYNVGTATEFRRSVDGWIKTTEIGGQVRRDVERIYDAFGTSAVGRQKGAKITIDGRETEVIVRPSQVQFKGVVPKDVDTSYIEKTLAGTGTEKGLGYRYKTEALSIESQEVIDLTEALNAQLRPRKP